METNTYQRFNQSIEKVFENVEDMDVSLDVGEWFVNVCGKCSSPLLSEEVSDTRESR